MRTGASTRVGPIVPHGLTAWDGIHVAIILAVTIAVLQLARVLVRRAVGADPDHVVARLVVRFVTYFVVLVGFIYCLVALRVQIGPLLGALGIGGIALAFALQDTLQNLVAGLLLQARRPFRRGDQVRIDRFEGTVMDVDLRNVSIVTFDGLNVYVPNKMVLEHPIVNYTRTPTRRNQLEVAVAYGTDLALAQRLLTDAAASTADVELRPPPAAWIDGFGESGVGFTLLFWHDTLRVSTWKARSDVAIAVKTLLDEASIVMPFPQRMLSFPPQGASVRLPLSPSPQRDAELA